VESASNAETACVEGDRKRDAGPLQCHSLRTDGVYLYVRAMEVTDDITRMAIDLIHRLDTRSEKQIHREFFADLKRVDGKMQILSRVAEAVVEQPDGIARYRFAEVRQRT
jgi:hypothetical protein